MPEFATSPSFESQLEQSLNFIARKDDRQIRQKQRKNLILSNIFGTTSGIRGKVNFTEMLVNEVSQPYQRGWQDKGGIKFQPNVWDIKYGKINNDFDPLALREQYIGEILDINNEIAVSNKLAQLYFNGLIGKLSTEMDDCLINGKFVAPVAGTAGSYLNTCDGLKEMIAKEVAAGKVATILNSTVISAANVGDVLISMWSSIPEDMKYNPNLKCYVFDSTAQLFREWVEEERGTMTDYTGIKMKIPRTDCDIVTLPYGRGSNMILFTTKDNVQIFTCQPSDVKRTNAEYSKDEMHVSMHYGTGIGFVISGNAAVVDEQYVWINSNCDFIASAEPDFTIDAVADAANTTATITGTASGDYHSFTETGIEYKKKANTTWTTAKQALVEGAMSKALTGLTANTDYEARIYGKTPAGTYRSSIVEFKTTNV